MKFYPILLFFLLFACKTPKSNTETAAANADAKEKVAEPSNVSKRATEKIIFLNYLFAKNEEDKTETVELIDKIIKEGKLKQDELGKPIAQVGDYLCLFMDKNYKLLKKAIIANPYVKSLEHVNEENEMERTEVKLEEAKYSLRTQLPFGTENIIIEKMEGPGQVKRLLLSKIEK